MSETSVSNSLAPLATTPLRALRVEVEGPVAQVVLQGPGKRNTMGPDFWRELPLVFGAIDADPNIRVAIVRGDKGDFSAGLDLMAAATTLGPYVSGAQLAADRLQLLRLIEQYQGAMNAVARCRKPVIAAVTGFCLGGGLDLVAACDIRVCAADAQFSLREVKVAIVADIGSLQRLPAIIGEGHTRELALTGKTIDAARALRIGLVSDVLEHEAALLDHARALAREIANNSPLVVQGIKEVMNDAHEPRVAAGLRHVALWNTAFLQSEDLGEALSAFAERRPPRFHGR